MRGVIRNRAAKQQICDFSGLNFPRGVTPTDIDASVDFDYGGSFAFLEIKGIGAPMPGGQRKHFEALCRTLIAGGANAICIVAEHSTPYDEDIAAHECPVREVLWHGKWRKPREPRNVREVLDRARERWSGGGLV